MIESDVTSPSSVTGVDTQRGSSVARETWFRTREGRRYGWEIALIVIVKLMLLVLLWFVFIKPWPRPATPAASVVQHFYLPVAPAARRD